MKKTFTILPTHIFLRNLIYVILPFLITFYTSCNWHCDKSQKHSTVYSDTITILSYNVENLFDLINNGTEFPDYRPYEHNWNHDTHAKKLDNIASAIAAANADILVLSEVENSTAAKQLQKALKRKKQSYRYIATGEEPNPATTCQVVLSRFPIVFSQGHGIPKSGEYFTRNILEADVAIGANKIKIFALHWPSKRYSESYRIAAANILLKRLKLLPPKTEYIIAGDFNCNYNEAETFFTERLDDTDGRTSINHLLKTVQSPPGSFIDYVTEQELIESQDNLFHYDLWLELPEYRRFSYKYKGQNNTLDHILLPYSLYDNSGISYVDNSFSVFTWKGRLIYNGVPYRWKTIYRKNGKYHVGGGYSDHLPIMAQFVVHPFAFSDSAQEMQYTNDSQAIQKRVIGFETGQEGWLPYNTYFRLSRDTVNTADGVYSLKIEGLSKKSVGAAHIRLPLTHTNKTSTAPPSFISLNLRGSGRFVFRMQIDDSPWTSYTGKNFTRKIRSTRYTNYSSNDWQTIQLPFPNIPENADAVDLQIRAAGKEALCIWIDNIKINGK